MQAGARFLEAPQGGRGVLLSGAPGVRSGPGRRDRCRQRRLERGDDRRRHGCRGDAARPQHRTAAGARARPCRVASPRSRRTAAASSAAWRSPTWSSVRCSCAGGRAPTVVDESMVAAHAARLGHRRRGDRPGRLHRDVPRDLAPGPCVRGARRPALLRRATSPARCRSPRPRRSPTPRCRTWSTGRRSGAVEACRRDPVAGPRAQHRGRRRRQRRAWPTALGMAAGTPRHRRSLTR